jgi:hypothetical protein
MGLVKTKVREPGWWGMPEWGLSGSGRESGVPAGMGVSGAEGSGATRYPIGFEAVFTWLARSGSCSIACRKAARFCDDCSLSVIERWRWAQHGRAVAGVGPANVATWRRSTSRCPIRCEANWGRRGRAVSHAAISSGWRRVVRQSDAKLTQALIQASGSGCF